MPPATTPGGRKARPEDSRPRSEEQITLRYRGPVAPENLERAAGIANLSVTDWIRSRLAAALRSELGQEIAAYPEGPRPGRRGR